MQIDPYQSVKIFGWWAQPRLTLAWEDVKHAQLSWRSLRNIGFQPGQLKALQPDKTEWLRRTAQIYPHTIRTRCLGYPSSRFPEVE